MTQSIQGVDTATALAAAALTGNTDTGSGFSDILQQVQSQEALTAIAEAQAQQSADGSSSADAALSMSNNLTAMMMMMALGGNGLSGDVSSILSTILFQLLGELSGEKETLPDAPAASGASSSVTPGYQPTNPEHGVIVNAALSRLGDPYSKPKSGQGDYTDCSYLSRWCYDAVGVKIPRTAAAQAKYCADNDMLIEQEELQAGDLIFFSLKENGRYKNISHVGIYAGNGMMVDASSARDEVVYREVFDTGIVMYGRPRSA